MVGFLAVNTLPARLGELVRAICSPGRADLDGDGAGVGRGRAALDLGFLGIFWALSLLFAPVPAWFRWSGIVTLVVTGGVGVSSCGR
jgi:hypothetical protein